MKSRRLALLIEEMNLGATQALSFVADLDFDSFLSDEKTQNAVGMCLVRIGEQAAKVIKDLPEFAEQYPSIPWESIRGMRNRLAHTYSETTLQTVWDTVKIFIPQLISELRKIEL